MRVVEKSADFADALASCKREAINSFGDDKVLVEKYLQRPRHIEIQVFADTHGNCVYLFERDCSVQRRHQKVIEEAPAPGMTAERRQAMGEAAVAAARAVGYVGAGTVEFIANQDGSFYFMEMNTRLQVEHPVTEMITGTDLVEWQLRVAAGEKLPAQQADLQINGHAIEARIYAENPEKGFLPSIGKLRYLRTPSSVEFSLGHSTEPAAFRIDSGVREGDTISPFYDPMIAKMIVWGKDRTEALARMRQALAQYRIVGLHTNIAFLSRLMHSDPFTHADLDTGLIERHHDSLFPVAGAPSASVLALAVAGLLQSEQQAGSDPWQSSHGWRMNLPLIRELRFSEEEQQIALSLQYSAGAHQLQIAGVSHTMQVRQSAGNQIQLSLDELTLSGEVIWDGEKVHIFTAGQHTELHYHDPLAHAGDAEAEGGRLTAPMPGKIVAVMTEKGRAVKKGEALLIMEAMKMEHTISAPHDGEVAEILYAVGDQVSEGAQLLAFAQLN